jgi:hypothetical protein
MMFAYIITCDYQGSQAIQPVESAHFVQSKLAGGFAPHLRVSRVVALSIARILEPGKAPVRYAHSTHYAVTRQDLCQVRELCLTDRREHGPGSIEEFKPVFSSVCEART